MFGVLAISFLDILELYFSWPLELTHHVLRPSPRGRLPSYPKLFAFCIKPVFVHESDLKHELSQPSRKPLDPPLRLPAIIGMDARSVFSPVGIGAT